MTRLLLLLATVCAVAYGECPNIISKSAWSIKKTGCQTALKSPVPWVIFHHSDTPPCTSKDGCITRARNILDYHTGTQGWCDIGYNFLIGSDGTILEGRGWSKVGAHAKGFNSMSIGICFIGNFQNGLPSEAAINAAKSLIRCGVELKKIKVNYTVKGHKDVTSTSCPGDALYNNLKKWDRFMAKTGTLP
ncbi:peptidoglycan recognition protein 1-like [Leptodactylus fuscus]